MKAYELSPRDAKVAVEVGKSLADAGHDEQAVPVLERLTGLTQIDLQPQTSWRSYCSEWIAFRMRFLAAVGG